MRGGVVTVGGSVDEAIDENIELVKMLVEKIVEREWEKIKDNKLVKAWKIKDKETMLKLVRNGLEKYKKMLGIEKIVRTNDKKFINVEQVITGLMYVIFSVAKGEKETIIRALQEISDATNRELLPLACLKGLKIQTSVAQKFVSGVTKYVYRAVGVPAYKTVTIRTIRTRRGLVVSAKKRMSLKIGNCFIKLNKVQYAQYTGGKEVLSRVEDHENIPHWRFTVDVPLSPAVSGLKERATDIMEYGWTAVEYDENGRLIIRPAVLMRFDDTYEIEDPLT